VPEGYPLIPAGPVLAPAVWGPGVSEQQSSHLSGVGFVGGGGSHLPFSELSATLTLPSCHPQELAEAPGDPQWMETIGRDLHRQFPLHEMFVSPQGHGYEAINAPGTPALSLDASAQFPTPALCLCVSGDPARARNTTTWAEVIEGG
jgi:hypothetical protein